MHIAPDPVAILGQAEGQLEFTQDGFDLCGVVDDFVGNEVATEFALRGMDFQPLIALGWKFEEIVPVDMAGSIDVVVVDFFVLADGIVGIILTFFKKLVFIIVK